MIDPGVLEELTSLWRRIVTLDTLRRMIMEHFLDRFGVEAESVKELLLAVDEEEKLLEIVRISVRCPDFQTFRSRLSAEHPDQSSTLSCAFRDSTPDPFLAGA